MLCNQCGKNNPFGVKECTYCGAPMPAQQACGGFADILTYQPPQAQQPTQFNQQRVAEPADASGYRMDPVREASFRKQLAKQQKFSRILFVISLVLIVGVFLYTSGIRSSVKEILKNQETIHQLQEQVNQLQETFDKLNVKNTVQEDINTIFGDALSQVGDAMTGNQNQGTAVTTNSESNITIDSEVPPTPAPTAAPTPEPTPDSAPEPTPTFPGAR